MVTLSHPYRSLASQGGEDQGDSAGPTRAQSGRSVEVERPFRPVDGVSLKSVLVTLSDPYRRLASLRGVDQGVCAGPTRAQSGRSVEVERPFPAHLCVSLESFMVTLSDPYHTWASREGRPGCGREIRSRQ